MDWLQCEVVEQIPGKVSGAPLIKGTRVRPEDVLNNLDLSEEDIAASFNLRREDVRAVLDFFYRQEAELTRT